MKKIYLNLHSRNAAIRCSVMLFCASLVLSFSTVNAQVKLVKDFNQVSTVVSGDFNYLTGYKAKAYFVFTDFNDSALPELWVSDGTYEGTVLLQRFEWASELKVSGEYLYFVASELTPDCVYDSDPCPFSLHGKELWRTDGTAEGTILLKDIFPGESGSGTTNLTDLDGTLYFTANDGIHGNELWKSNGTAEGTVLVKDIQRIGASSQPKYLTALNHILYFSANDGIKGFELWRSDGTDAGTFMVVDLATANKISSSPQQIVNANGTLYFFANDHINGNQLWKSDGSSGNATLVKIIRPGSNNLNYLTSVNDLVFFQANDGVHGNEPWRSDGTDSGTFLVKDITPGHGSDTQYATPHISDFRSSNGKLYFFGVNGDKRLWISDGTTDGTKILTDKNFYMWASHAATAFNGETFFGLDNGYDVNGYSFATSEIWKTNGTPEGTESFKIIEAKGFESNFMPTVVGNTMFMIIGDAIWKTDGTKAGTERIRGLSNKEGSSNPSNLTDVDGTLFFQAKDGDYGHILWKTSSANSDSLHVVNPWLFSLDELKNVNGELFFNGSDARDYSGEEPWHSDGTFGGTTIIKDIAIDSVIRRLGSDPSQFNYLNGNVFFRAAAFQKPFDLWKTDGTEVGTTTIKDITRENFDNPTNLTTVGNKLFFAGENSRTGQELWVTDGTTAGTVLLKDIKVNAPSSGAIRFTSFNNLLYFQADDGSSGYELWRSDGTTRGTYRVKNICLNDQGDANNLAPLDMGDMIATSKAVFFTAILPNGKNAFWKSNGTAGSTLMLKEFDGQPTANILSILGNSIVFTLKYPTHLELWISAGTAASTLKVTELSDLQKIVEPYEVTKINNVVYFLGYDGLRNRIWRTNGTETGTYEIIFDGNTHEIEASGGVVFVSAETKRWGWELFWIDDNTSMMNARKEVMEESEIVDKQDMEEEQIINGYPNPFSSQFVLDVKGSDNNTFELNVLSVEGRNVEYYQSLPCNTANTIGQSWSPGVYVIHIYTGEKYLTKKVIKIN